MKIVTTNFIETEAKITNTEIKVGKVEESEVDPIIPMDLTPEAIRTTARDRGIEKTKIRPIQIVNSGLFGAEVHQDIRFYLCYSLAIAIYSFLVYSVYKEV